MSSIYIPDVVQPNPSSVSRGGAFDCNISFKGGPPSGDTTVNLTYSAWVTGSPSQTVDPALVLSSLPSSVVATPSENPKVVHFATLTNAPVPSTVQITATVGGHSASGTVNVTT